MTELIWNPECPVAIPAACVAAFTEHDVPYGMRNTSRSYRSFCTKKDIRRAFSKTEEGKHIYVPEDFIEAFEYLVINMNIMPPRTPITVMWNKHLPRFDSTLQDQDFKAFTSFPDDLPLNYGSLTAMRTSFRPWVGRSGAALEVPGLEFFATTGEYKDEQEWRNPEGTWFRQIIPQGCQLLRFFNELKRICSEENKHNPKYDYELEDDSLEGRITWSSKGVHFAPLPGQARQVGNEWGFDWGFLDDLDDVFEPSFSSELQIGEGGVALNAFAHAAGLEVGAFLKASVFNTGNHTEEHGDPRACTSLGTTPALAKPALEKVSRFEKMSGFTKTASDLAPAGKLFRQIIQVEVRHHNLYASGILSQNKAPTLPHGLGVHGLSYPATSQSFTRAAEVALGMSFNAQSQAPDKTPVINGLSARAHYHELFISLNATAQAPDDPPQVLTVSQSELDIPRLSLRASVLELMASLNAQAQASVRFITPFNQVRPSFATNDYIHPLRIPIVPSSKSLPTLSRIQKQPTQGSWRSVVDVLFLGTRFVRLDLDGVKSGGFGSGFLYRVCWFNFLRAFVLELMASLNAQAQAPDEPQYVHIPQGGSRDFSRFITPFNQVLPRFATNDYIHPLRYPIGVPPSKSLPTLSRKQKTPAQGFWRSVVDVLFLGTRFVRQDLDGVKSGVFGSGFLYRVCWFNVFRCPTLYTSLYVSFA